MTTDDTSTLIPWLRSETYTFQAGTKPNTWPRKFHFDADDEYTTGIALYIEGENPIGAFSVGVSEKDLGELMPRIPAAHIRGTMQERTLPWKQQLIKERPLMINFSIPKEIPVGAELSVTVVFEVMKRKL